MSKPKDPEDLKIRRDPTEIVCKGPCGLTKPANKDHFFYRTSKNNGKSYPSSYCKICEKAKSAKSRKDRYSTSTGKAIIQAQNESYRKQPEAAAQIRLRQNMKYAENVGFREQRKASAKEWKKLNPSRNSSNKASWFQKNYARLRDEWNERFRTDPAFRLRNNLRRAIWETLRYSGGCKGGRSILKFLPYTMEELRSHLESLWEPWMSWGNYGVLDPNRRTWQIDHIIPQTALPFDDFEHQNFVVCWSLSNLRPLDSSKNLEKGCKPQEVL